MKPFREGHKFFHEGSCINQELPFQIGRFSNHFCSHNEKKRFIFCFRGPFWALLGTPLQPHHHDFYIPSLLHHDASPTMNSNFWPPFKYQIFGKNTQKWPLLGVFLGPNFPMKLFREGHKIFHEASCINQELPFQIGRFSNHFCSRNEKKTIYFSLQGPFLGTFRYPIIAPPS